MANLADKPSVVSRFRVQLDDRGRAIPPTGDERQVRLEALRPALAKMRVIPDDPAEDDAEFLRALGANLNVRA